MYVTYAVTFVVQSVMTLAISEVFELRVFWASLPTIIVVTILSYFGHKYFTFRASLQGSDEAGISAVFTEADEARDPSPLTTPAAPAGPLDSEDGHS
jgi:hypothetical protein